MQSHDPLLFRLTGSKAMGPLDENERMEPLVKPVLSDRAKQLAGVLAYEWPRRAMRSSVIRRVVK
jgi:hypothetical protein